MERAKYLVAIIFLMLSFTNDSSYKSEIYEAYIRNDMGRWRAIIDEMNMKESKSEEFILELINYQYGFIAWCISKDKIELAKKYMELAEKNIEILSSKNFELSSVYSYKSALYGCEIRINVLKAPVIGTKSLKFLKMAIEIDENNPWGYIQYANRMYYMPAIFGGSKDIAVENYKKAQRLMENGDYNVKNDWNYLNLLTTIAQAFSDLKKYEEAKYYYDKVLGIEPDFIWVKNKLYPELLQQMK